eukprot:gene22375-biopygen16244
MRNTVRRSCGAVCTASGLGNARGDWSKNAAPQVPRKDIWGGQYANDGKCGATGTSSGKIGRTRGIRWGRGKEEAEEQGKELNMKTQDDHTVQTTPHHTPNPNQPEPDGAYWHRVTPPTTQPSRMALCCPTLPCPSLPYLVLSNPHPYPTLPNQAQGVILAAWQPEGVAKSTAWTGTPKMMEANDNTPIWRYGVHGSHNVPYRARLGSNTNMLESG